MGLTANSKNMVILVLKFIDVVEFVSKVYLHGCLAHTSCLWPTIVRRRFFSFIVTSKAPIPTDKEKMVKEWCSIPTMKKILYDKFNLIPAHCMRTIKSYILYCGSIFYIIWTTSNAETLVSSIRIVKSICLLSSTKSHKVFRMLPSNVSLHN